MTEPTGAAGARDHARVRGGTDGCVAAYGNRLRARHTRGVGRKRRGEEEADCDNVGGRRVAPRALTVVVSRSHAPGFASPAVCTPVALGERTAVASVRPTTTTRRWCRSTAGWPRGLSSCEARRRDAQHSARRGGDADGTGSDTQHARTTRLAAGTHHAQQPGGDSGREAEPKISLSDCAARRATTRRAKLQHQRGHKNMLYGQMLLNCADRRGFETGQFRGPRPRAVRDCTCAAWLCMCMDGTERERRTTAARDGSGGRSSRAVTAR